MNDQFVRRANGTTRFGLTKTVIQSAQIPLPTIPEQRKIAAILSTVDDAIAVSRKVIEQTKRVKVGLLHTLMTRGTGHTAFKTTEIGEIPQHWEVRQLGELAIFQNGKAIKPEQWQSDGLPIIRIPQLSTQDQIEHFIDPGDVEDRYLVRSGDLLFSWSGSLTISRWERHNAALNQHIFNVRPRANEDRDFLEFLLKYSVQALEARTHGTTMRHITKSSLLSFLAPRPPREEQQEIALRMTSLEHVERCHRMVEEKLNLLKHGLLQDLLTGRVRVQPG